MNTVVIVGGGIAGLSTAYSLEKMARQRGVDLDCCLIEEKERLGGVIHTEEQAGFLLDAGPDSFLVEKPWALELCKELDLEDRLLPTNAYRQGVYILSDGRLKSLPPGLMLTVPTRFSSFLACDLFTLRGKLRMASELYRPRKTDDADESIADFVGRRFGQEAVAKLADPLMAGIFAGDAKRLSMRSTFPRFVELEKKYGSLIKGLRRAKTPRGRTPRPLFLSLKGGIEELVKGLEERLRDSKILLGKQVVSLRRLPRNGSQRYELFLHDHEPLQANSVILAVPAFSAARLLERLDGELASQLHSIRLVSTAVIFLGYDERDLPHPLDGFGFLVPPSEGHMIFACTWVSSKFNHRAPAGSILMRCFVGGAHNENLVDEDDATLLDLARGEIKEILGITAQPKLARIFRWEKANPQYEMGHGEKISAIEERVNRHSGLFVTGSSYRGVGIPDCIRDGQETAERILGRES